MSDDRKKVIVLTGPTAVGKTELSIHLAKLLNGEIISADSVQVYRDMNIGSAKITTKEMDGVKHHLIDILDPNEEFNIALFKDYCVQAMNEIYSKGKIPIITGGTGFYIQSVIYDIDFAKTAVNDIRSKYEKLANEHGNLYVHELLAKVDTESAKAIHPNNVKRVIRALEYYEETGEKISAHNEAQRQNDSPYNFAYFVLNCDRGLLYERIDKRVDIMVKEGLVDEVSALIDKYNLTRDMVSMQALGYKEIYDYLKGDISLDDAIYTIKRDTRHFAKRQLTWFRREKEVTFVDKDSLKTLEQQLEFITGILKEKNIIDGL